MTHTRDRHPTPDTVGPSRTNRLIVYGVLAVVVVTLAITGLVIYQSGQSSQDAEAKADQLIGQLQQSGLRTPAKETIVRVLGDDGGAVCANPGNALTKAALTAQLVIADSRFLQGELAIVSVYCPERLQEIQDFRDSLKTAEVAG
jgi:hypothetical protein